MHNFDFITIGAGSAGCVLARRLSDAGNKVLLIEAGINDKSWILRMPAGLRSTFKPSSKYNYWFKSIKHHFSPSMILQLVVIVRVYRRTILLHDNLPFQVFQT